MKSVIIIIGLLVAAVAWLRMQWAVGRNKRVAGKIVDRLKDGTYAPESLAESLPMLIRTRPLPENANLQVVRQNMAGLTNNRLRDKFKVQYATMNPDNKGVVIAEGVVRDQLSGGTAEVDVTYPCWLYIEITEPGNEIRFRSSMPDGKDHHYLLEDISDAIFERCVGK